MERNDRKTRIGVIVSDKMDKTVVVEGGTASSSIPFYGKAVRRSKNFKAHDDEQNQYKTGKSGQDYQKPGP